MAVPITIALSMAFTHSLAEADPGFVSARVDFQSMSFKNGYAASESFLAAIDWKSMSFKNGYAASESFLA